MSQTSGAGELGLLRDWFEQEMFAWLPDRDCSPQVLHEAMRYACAAGKRIRPLLCLGAAVACGAGREQAVSAAIALELIHCYSLVHDDLPAMDDDSMRRGRPTVHVAHGEAQAILAGDALLTAAFAVLAGTSPLDRSDADIRGRLAIVGELAVAAGYQGMVAGQAMELATQDSAAGSAAQEIARLKTGVLMRASCRIGGLSASAPPRLMAALTSFGEDYGLAYQIVDDLNDHARDAALGRSLNMALIYGYEQAASMAQETVARARQTLCQTQWPASSALLLQLCGMLNVVL